ncbi:MAG: hypothetical protein ACRYGF_04580 [Janthinobacterium lividum]
MAQVVISGHASGNFRISGGTATPLGVVASSSPSTIVATWTTVVPSSSTMACGVKPGVFTKAALDDSSIVTISHQSIVAGLLPSTTYFCQVLNSSSATGTGILSFSATTSGPDESTPITGISLGAISTYNSINPHNQMTADTFYNCKANDGTTYLTTDDTKGWQQNGYPARHGSPLSLVKFTSESPLAGITVNPFSAYGPDSVGTGDDQMSQKNSGLFCMNGNIFMTLGRQLNQATGGMGSNTAYTQTAGQIIWSPDKGISWNNFQNPASFNVNGSPTNPASASMFGTSPTNMASATFVMYCADDGTLGYLAPCNRHDNADAYVYLMANDGYWDSGNALYLARVPRAKLASLTASDYAFYTAGDGSLDASWTSVQANARPVIANPGKLGEPNVQFIPALNRYLLLTFSYPESLAVANRHSEHSLWLAYESPHPWGPWKLVNTTDWPTQGYYNPVILTDTAYSGLNPTIMFTGDFFGSGTYQMYLSTMSILH